MATKPVIRAGNYPTQITQIVKEAPKIVQKTKPKMVKLTQIVGEEKQSDTIIQETNI
jgi:hypothetical protein